MFNPKLGAFTIYFSDKVVFTINTLYPISKTQIWLFQKNVENFKKTLWPMPFNDSPFLTSLISTDNQWFCWYLQGLIEGYKDLSIQAIFSYVRPQKQEISPSKCHYAQFIVHGNLTALSPRSLIFQAPFNISIFHTPTDTPEVSGHWTKTTEPIRWSRMTSTTTTNGTKWNCSG